MLHEKKNIKNISGKINIIERLNRKKSTKTRKNTKISNRMCKVEVNGKNDILAFFELVLGGKLPA